jgi:hypothetical protein
MVLPGMAYYTLFDIALAGLPLLFMCRTSDPRGHGPTASLRRPAGDLGAPCAFLVARNGWKRPITPRLGMSPLSYVRAGNRVIEAPYIIVPGAMKGRCYSVKNPLD